MNRKRFYLLSSDLLALQVNDFYLRDCYMNFGIKVGQFFFFYDLFCLFFYILVRDLLTYALLEGLSFLFLYEMGGLCLIY
jgi:hypothetical protein